MRVGLHRFAHGQGRRYRRARSRRRMARAAAARRPGWGGSSVMRRHPAEARSRAMVPEMTTAPVGHDGQRRFGGGAPARRGRSRGRRPSSRMAAKSRAGAQAPAGDQGGQGECREQPGRARAAARRGARNRRGWRPPWRPAGAEKNRPRSASTQSANHAPINNLPVVTER